MTPETLAQATLAAPLLAFALVIVALRRQHALASALVIAAGLVSAIGSLWLLALADGTATVHATRWLTIGDTDLTFGFLLDGRSRLMGAVVGVVTLMIQLYSLGYMAHDPGRARFFAFLALFEWSMLGFAYAPDLLQAFIFWELVGLASFLLIGFWYHKPSAIAAAKKAFIMTRIGDVGMLIGLILLFQQGGTLDIVDIGLVFGLPGLPPGMDAASVDLIGLLLLAGIVGKSAQLPLHTWLPDAMEGPTPVSALLHSATMVAAGVFLFARFHELFMDAELTRTVTLTLAATTALVAATMAMVATDIKKVLAYSSISQLGYMLMGLAAGSLFAGLFHLTTHAAFKALLFLCAGGFIHAAGTNDLVAIGRAGGRTLKVTAIGLLVGAAALAGIPGFSGASSKETILHALHGPETMVFLGMAYLTAALTAYYSFRVVFLIFRPQADSAAAPEEPADPHHAHGPPGATMRLPIALLALAAAALGWAAPQLAALLGTTAFEPTLADVAPAAAVVAAGIAAAWLDFGRAGAAQTGFVARFPALHRLFARGWYFDALYDRTFVRASGLLADLMKGTEDHGLDASTDQLAAGTLGLGRAASRGQGGHLQLYIGLTVVLLAGVGLWMGLSL